jgi:serine/threonine protein kinase/tetratricopeptide (TPR) repeat protein
MKCPKCDTENLSDSKYCKECATPLPPSEEIPVSPTKTMKAPREELSTGSTFAERYQIIEELGRGGMGVVYKAQDTKLKRTVALKFLPPELAHILGVKERFMREAQAAAALDHPNICTVHEIDEAEGKTFISMAYVEGESLREKNKSGPLKLDEALAIILQVAEGLEEAHKKEIVHRDIKSANIMVDKKGQAKIMDFGLAKVAGGSLITREARTMGTVAYMSPEQARGEEVDSRSDIWSFGIVLYEMLSGQLPFKGERETSIMYSIIHEEPKPLKDIKPDIPAELEQIAGKALTKDLQDRYQHIEDLIDDLNSISKGFVPPKIKAAIRRAKIARIRRVYLYGGIAGFFVLLIATALYFFALRGKVITSIAVLPFENVSGDPETEILSDGITETLINKLAQLPKLKKVISRESVFAYKGQKIDPKRVGQELDVKAVLTSRMIQHGDELSISIALVNTGDSSHIWGEKYSQKLEDIFVLEEEMATAITQALQLKLTGEEKRRLTKRYTEDTEAYQLYIKGRFFRSKLTVEGFKKAIEYFQQAIEKDPTYALAYAGLADVYSVQSSGWGFLLPKDGYPMVEAAAKKALELDNTLAEAYTALGTFKLIYDWDWAGAKRELERALELNPGCEQAHWMYAIYLTAMGRHKESIDEAKQALKLNPISIQTNTTLGNIFLRARQYDQAIEQLQKTIELDPTSPLAPAYLGIAYLQKSMFEEAMAMAQKSGPWASSETILYYAMTGKKEEARKMVGELKREWGNRVPTFLVWAYASLGEKDKTFEWLQKAYDQRDFFMHQLKVEPLLDPLRSDPRFQDFMHRMNFPK